MRRLCLIIPAVVGCFVSCAAFKGSDSAGGTTGGDAGDAASAATTGDAGSCGTEYCATGDHTCRTWLTTPGSCPGDWLSSGDPPDASNPIFACESGKLHVFADNTLDLTAKTSVDVLPATKAIHVSATIAVKDYRVLKVPMPTLFRVTVGQSQIALNVTMSAKGNPELHACEGPEPGNCAAQVLTAMPSEPHTFSFLIAKDAVTISADCQPQWTLAGVAIDTPLTLAFGSMDGQPIDATLHNVMVSFD